MTLIKNYNNNINSIKHTHATVSVVCNFFVYLSSCLNYETAKWPLRSSSQAATCSVTTSLTTQR